MKKLSALVSLLLCIVAAEAAPDFFPIMPWNHAPNDPAVLQRIKDCGFTMAGFVSPDMLDACEKIGLKAIVHDPRTSGYDWAKVDAAKARSNVASLIAEFGKHPAVFGYYLRDEPTAAWFPNLEKVAAPVRELAPGQWAYINLFPDYASDEQLGTAGFRLQAYSTLACGGRGLSWFTYFAPRVGGYRDAPIDQFGHETATWQLLQNVNLQVQKLATTMLQLQNEDAYHLGIIPPGCHGPSTNSLVSGIAGDNALVGDFTHPDGSRYVMVVNKSLTASRVCQPQFRKPPKSLQHISPYTGQLTPYEGEYTWLAPGQGVLLKPE